METDSGGDNMQKVPIAKCHHLFLLALGRKWRCLQKNVLKYLDCTLDTWRGKAKMWITALLILVENLAYKRAPVDKFGPVVHSQALSNCS